MDRSLICFILTGCLAALASPALADVESVQPVGATPANDAASWIATGDYPPAALRANAQGTTGFLLSIDEQGAVAGCQIVKSSGSVDLDAATCALLVKRAHFNPAMDQDGHAAKGVFRSSVRWVLPTIVYRAPTAGSIVHRMIIEPDGRPSDCQSAGGYGNGTQLAYEPCPNAHYQPYRSAGGQPVRKIVTVTSITKVEDAPN